MGLSASQGRMLLLTARKDDLEFRAQQISQRRLNLSQQLEKISTDYEDATSDRQMKINMFDMTAKDNNNDYITATKNLTYAALVSQTANLGAEISGIQANDVTGNQEFQSNTAFRLVDANGAIVVSDESEIPTFYKHETTDENFASIGTTTKKEKVTEDGKEVEKDVIVKTELATLLDENVNAIVKTDGNTIKVVIPKENGGQQVRYFNKDGSGLESSDSKVENYNTDEESKYKITPNDDGQGNYTFSAVKTENLSTGFDAKSVQRRADGKIDVKIDGKWQTYVVDHTLATGSTDSAGDKTAPNYLQDCLRNGKYLIQKGSVDTEDQNKYKWSALSWDSASGINDQYYTENDDKAKAKYDRLQNQIQNQDKKLELELDNIETQRKAVTTEVESVQKVMDDNIDSTFKIFS